MDTLTIILIILNIILITPLIYVGITRKFLNNGFDISIAYAKILGYLISVNGPIRIGKTSFQSGLKHIYEILIEEELQSYMTTVHKIYKRIEFNQFNEIIDTYLENKESFDLDQCVALLQTHLKLNGYEIEDSLINNFYSLKTTTKYLEDYIFAYYVYYYRRNYVQSKTKFYSHITCNFSYEYNTEHQKIHEAFIKRDYSIYDYMVELIDELSDELAAAMRFNDVKEQSGNKDYLRKYGQIHQERNRLISTKQDVTDEIKKHRNLTQSNLWLPQHLETRGTNRLLLKVISAVFQIIYFFYLLARVKIPYLVYYKHKYKLDYEEFYDMHYKRINFQRSLDNKLLHIDWYLFSIGFIKYVVRDYPDEEKVKSENPEFFRKMVFYIPLKYCFGTYDTHAWRTIQKELLNVTTTKSKETNWFINPPYFKERGAEADVELDFES